MCNRRRALTQNVPYHFGIVEQADWLCDCTAVFDFAVNKGGVGLFYAFFKFVNRKLVLGNQHNSRGVAVKAVMSAENVALSPFLCIIHHDVREGVGLVLFDGVNRHKRRFIYREDEVVLVQNFKLSLYRLDILRLLAGEVYGDYRSCLYKINRAQELAVHQKSVGGVFKARYQAS